MSQEIDILKRALQREKAARKSAEKILEAKSLALFQITKKLESLLEEKSNQLQGVFENIVDAYVVIDLKGEILKSNEAAAKLFGFDMSNGKFNVIDLVYPEDLEHATKSFQQLKTHGFFKNFEIRVNTKSNEIKRVHINASVIYDSHKNPIATQGIVRDITEIKNLEIQKENLLQTLEKRNIMLQEYAHVVSHDLKAPLRSIDALINWIKEDNKGKFDKASLQNFNLIETTLEKMEKLISDVLAYSSIGLQAMEKVNLDETVYEVIKHIYVPDHITIDVKSKLPILNGNPTKLQQLFQNLLSNAIKFNDKAVGRIGINVMEEKDFYQFSIIDNGIGIEKKFHGKIFEVFHALHKSKDSTGIGLSIVKKIVELHQGKIWLESEPNVGTCFFFTLKK